MNPLVYPSLTVLEPQPDAYLNETRPLLRFEFLPGAAGVDAGSFRLINEEGGEHLALDCVFDDREVNCYPLLPFVDGAQSLLASVSDEQGNSSIPVPVHFTIDTVAPVINVTHPEQNSVFSDPVQLIQGSVSEPAIVHVDGAPMSLTSDLAFTHQVVLKDGLNVFSFTATDRAGNVGASSLRIILQEVEPGTPSVDPESVLLRFDGSVVEVEGAAGSAPPGAGVSITNSRTGEVVLAEADESGAFFVRLDALPNDTFLIVVYGPDGSASSPTEITAIPAATIAIVTPEAGAQVEGLSTTVTGTIDGPANVGVLVNGVLALVREGQFYANAVPLEAGSNTITATYYVITGENRSHSIAVTSAGESPFEVGIDPASSFAPASIHVLIESESPIGNLGIVPHGGGVIAGGAVEGTSAWIEMQYESPGVYIPVVTIANATGQHSKSVVVVIQDTQQQEMMLKDLWAGMLEALVAGRVSEALHYVSVQARDRYEEIFRALLPHFSEIVATYSPLQGSSMDTEFAEFGLAVETDAGPELVLIYFIRGADGLWRVDSM